MKLTELTCEQFIAQLSSSAPVPGGGGASALTGAIGMALGSMVGELTKGKQKYSDVQQDMLRLGHSAKEVMDELLELVQADADVFAPLAEAYGLPKSTAEQAAYKAQVMESALKAACEVPLKIMQCCCRGIELLEEYAQKGSSIAISDAGVGAAFFKSALQGASLNVFINTKAMQDRTYARFVNQKAEEMLTKYTALADSVYSAVAARLV